MGGDAGLSVHSAINTQMAIDRYGSYTLFTCGAMQRVSGHTGMLRIFQELNQYSSLQVCQGL